jgi:hypothetical protein
MRQLEHRAAAGILAGIRTAAQSCAVDITRFVENHITSVRISSIVSAAETVQYRLVPWAQRCLANGQWRLQVEGGAATGMVAVRTSSFVSRTVKTPIRTEHDTGVGNSSVAAALKGV